MRTNKFVKKNYVNELLAIIKGNFTENELKKKIANYHEKDIADALTHLTEQERKRVYGILGAKNVAEIFTYIDDVEKYFARKQELTKRTEQVVGDKPIQKENVSHPKSRTDSVLQALRERQAKIKEQEQTATKEKSRTHKKGEVSL